LTGRLEQTILFAPAVKRYVKWSFLQRTSRGAPWAETETDLVKWESAAQLHANLALPVAAR